MPVSSIAQILIRLYALTWFITGVIVLVQSLYGTIGFYVLLTPVIYLAAGGVLWFFAPIISRFAADKNDGLLSLAGVSEQNLYAAVFIGVGVFMILDKAGSVISWIHFFAIYKSPDYGFHMEAEEPSYYDLVDPAISVAAGIVLVFTARRWAAKLCKPRKPAA